MTVAIPISRFDSSGGIRVLSILANGLVSRGYSVSFVVPRGKHQPFFPLADKVAIRVVGSDLGNGPIGGALKKLQLAFGLPEGTDVAIANAFMTAYSVHASRLLRRSRRGLYFVQGYEPSAFGDLGSGPFWLKFLRKKMAEQTYGLPLERISNSSWTAEMLQRHHNAGSVVAPLGVDSSVFRPLRATVKRLSDSPVVMTIGNSNPVKRFGLFQETAVILRARIECRFLVATHDRSIRERGGIPAEFVAPSNDPQLAEAYNRASVFVSTSVNEGFGLPLLEAMACGVPVVTTDAGGIRDFCRDGVNCRIVRSAAPCDLAEAVVQIQSDKAFYNRLVENGLRTAKEWCWERLVDVFEHVLQRGRSASAREKRT